MTNTNYYDIMGVEPEAPAAAIETAYWRAARELHKRRDPQAASELLLLNEAYETLANSSKRAAYNREVLPPPPPEQRPRRRSLLARLWPR